MYKYLYGKKAILQPIIDFQRSFRLSDLSHYARLENELMRDEEMIKVFTLDKDKNTIKINDVIINNNSLAKDIEIRLNARHCYCLCLSKTKNSDELFDKFKADICIEIDANLLIEFFEKVFLDKLPGSEIIARDIKYYSNNYLPRGINEIDLVFMKPKSFEHEHENEFRIALFYPKDKSGFKIEDNEVVPIMRENDSNHIDIHYSNSEFLKQFIIGHQENT